jgi:predicted Zn-dependent protease
MADFRAAADAYRKLIEADIRSKDEVTLTSSLVIAYADSLGSIAQHSDGAREFQATLRPARGISDDLAAQIKLEEAGLLVMAGDESMARSLGEGPLSFAPEHGARLGWWYYRAGKYDAATKALQRFLSQRPGDPGLQITLGWVKLEQNAPADAARVFESSPTDETPASSSRAGQVIALWRLRQTDKETDAAISEFDQLAKEAPEWTNPTWVHAVYGRAAAQSAQEMYAEQQRRIAARKWRGQSRSSQ